MTEISIRQTRRVGAHRGPHQRFEVIILARGCLCARRRDLPGEPEKEDVFDQRTQRRVIHELVPDAFDDIPLALLKVTKTLQHVRHAAAIRRVLQRFKMPTDRGSGECRVAGQNCRQLAEQARGIIVCE